MFQELLSRDRGDGLAAGLTIAECESRIADLGKRIEVRSLMNGYGYSSRPCLTQLMKCRNAFETNVNLPL